MAHRHIIDYLQPYNDAEDMIKERRYNQGYGDWQVEVYNELAATYFCVRPEATSDTLCMGRWFSFHFPPSLL